MKSALSVIMLLVFSAVAAGEFETGCACVNWDPKLNIFENGNVDGCTDINLNWRMNF